MTQNKRLHTETIGNRFFRVIERQNKLVQIWVDYPAGESCGWPECLFSGDLENARKFWKIMKKSLV
jgi:hypothetical protein